MPRAGTLNLNSGLKDGDNKASHFKGGLENSLIMGVEDEISEQGSPQSIRPNAKAGELLVLRTGLRAW